MSESFTLIFELGRQHLLGSIHPGVITLVSTAPLSRSAIFDKINADVLFRRVNSLFLATFMCPIVIIMPCFNMSGGEWGLKIQSEIYPHPASLTSTVRPSHVEHAP